MTSKIFLLFIFAAVMVSAKVHSFEADSPSDVLAFDDDAKTERTGRSLPQGGACPGGRCMPPNVG
uniref:Seminal fluid protein HACP015 n=1 Tax=Heliconius melpomene TaxID=34740 RepID=D9HQ74_HELME|nr:seminal fluid protein HACP015 [Heliconius melpomene]